jgi:hypothetical protein
MSLRRRDNEQPRSRKDAQLRAFFAHPASAPLVHVHRPQAIAACPGKLVPGELYKLGDEKIYYIGESEGGYMFNNDEKKIGLKLTKKEVLKKLEPVLTKEKDDHPGPPLLPERQSECGCRGKN